MRLLFILINLFFTTAVYSQPVVQAAFWEPYVNNTTGIFYTNDGRWTAGDSTAATEDDKLHGYAVQQLMLQDINNINISWAGFVPLSRHLQASGAWNMTVTQRRQHVKTEQAYYKEFARKTVAYFRQQKVRIVNISWGTSYSIFLERNENMGYSNAEKQLGSKKWILGFKKSLETAFASAPEILFIVAAGNDGEHIDSAIDVPAIINLPNVLCVGALDKNGQKADFSNYGSRVDIYLPGEAVNITMPDGSIQQLDGTSLSVPQASNKAIKFLQQNQTLSAPALKQLLIQAYSSQ